MMNYNFLKNGMINLCMYCNYKQFCLFSGCSLIEVHAVLEKLILTKKKIFYNYIYLCPRANLFLMMMKKQNKDFFEFILNNKSRAGLLCAGFSFFIL